MKSTLEMKKKIICNLVFESATIKVSVTVIGKIPIVHTI